MIRKEFYLEDWEEPAEMGTCAWCGEEFPVDDMVFDAELGYLCSRCEQGIASREGKDAINQVTDKDEILKIKEYGKN